MADVKVGDFVVVNPDVLPVDRLSSDHWLGIITDTAGAMPYYYVRWLIAPHMNWKSTAALPRELRLYEAIR